MHFTVNVVLQKGERKSLLSCKFSEKEESLMKCMMEHFPFNTHQTLSPKKSGGWWGEIQNVSAKMSF